MKQLCWNLFFLLLAAETTAASAYLEPSQRTKAIYRDARLKNEQHRRNVNAKKEQVRQILEEKRKDTTSTLRSFPLQGDDKNHVVAATHDRPSVDKESLLEELQSMIYLSSLIYAFAAVRKTVREGGIQQSRLPWAKQRLQLENSHIILENDKDDNTKNGCLKYALTGEDLEQILTPSNMERLANDKELSNQLDIEAIRAMKELGKDGILWEFDDHIGDSRQLVYAITINQAVRRVTVIFRGSVNAQDWITNFTVGPKKLAIPTCLSGNDLVLKDAEGDPIAVHSGFYDYLDQSFDHIVQNLKAIYKQYPGYDLYITGHSLGGALATLLSYQLAADKFALPIPFPITCISYAAPLLGNPSFRQAFQALENLGRLRHVRVTNRFDVVPLSPPFGGYVQTGVNLHLSGSRSGDYKVSYDFNSTSDLLKSFLSQFSPWHSPAAHSLVDYWRQGEVAEDKYLDKLQEGMFDAVYVSDLYKRMLPRRETTASTSSTI